MKVVVCERCLSIPKITIINPNKVLLECQICRSNNTSGIDYFNRFINVNENDDLFTLPICNFGVHHNVQAILYCFKCDKYLCNDCLERHDEFFQGRGHITINQKIKHQYFCAKSSHEENVLNLYCLKCNKYLCCDCKDCMKEHQENDIYNFDNIENEINEIKNNIKKCKEIIEKEEIYCKNFIKELENKIQVLKNLFDNYKKRNNDLILIYNLLIDNFEQLKNIKNYNLRNNLILNNNFYLKNSITYDDECLISNVNRMCEFYRNTNHIKTKEFSN